MQPVIESLSGLKRRVVLEVSVANVEDKFQKQLRDFAKKTKISGFRPGKAPINMIERSHGFSIRQDIISGELSDTFEKVIKSENINIVRMPSIVPSKKSTENNEVLTFEATFEIYPEVIIPDFSEVSVIRYVSEIKDEDVNKTIDFLRQQKSSFISRKNKVVSEGDKVTLSFIGSIDDKSFQGGSSDSFSFIVGKGKLLPDFENAVLGMIDNEEKVFNVTFPDDYHDKTTAGKTAKFSIKILEVCENILPELNDDFAKLFSHEKLFNLDMLRQEVLDSLKRDISFRLKNRNKKSVMDALSNLINFDIPEVLIEDEKNNMLSAFKDRIKSKNSSDNLDSISLDIFSEEAKKRVGVGLLVSELSNKNNLLPTDEQIVEYFKLVSKNYQDSDKLIKQYLSDKKHYSDSKMLILEDNVVNYIFSLAKVTDEVVSFEDLMGIQ
ncbi:trigger factor [Candidatus Kinetoplastibacterium blastocrithidii TCC012E]|uniref:Trigger factor n=1 Tax=Candidatus Kinetoplastidibacterium blastocrithidiae TCC012E TaxID=1208922 RepID=M1MD30_9PROT|nr:trigger factor [Candidatus Kinetoplastibacterium blastocrithidii]AFZ83556.1 trigger factor [Candidatus Kinetoplastibacterium blastocrithidii (ex Strigomonas culicis)]AGF49675.1 trigger factor [Candidatus Kinetoplastibacterium blastocrithidii TCC012E]